MRVGLLELRAVNDLQAGRLDEAEAQLAEALELATALDDESYAMDAQYFRDYVDGVRARSRGGLTRVVDTGSSCARRGYESTGVTAYRNASMMAIRLMDYDGARNSLVEGLQYADSIEQSYAAG